MRLERRQREAKYYREDLGGGFSLDLVRIPEGRFWMGSPESEAVKSYFGEYEESPRHQVFVPAFFMGKYPVTQLQWHAVSLLSKVNKEIDPDSSEFRGFERPVDRVRWDDAVEFCKRLSKKTGKDYRLPSEAEWEYACRAGMITPYHFGKTITKDLANYSFAYKGTTEVGKFPANAFGLYDMHGNVAEWCLDDWHYNYKGAPTDGSAWMTWWWHGRKNKVLRGGDRAYRSDF